jgi:hypothetical protein
MNDTPVPPQSDAEIIWFLEEQGLLKKRPVHERWPELFEQVPAKLPALIDDAPAHDRPEAWEEHEYPGYDASKDMDWPPAAKWRESEDEPDHPPEPGALDRDSNRNFGPQGDGHDPQGRAAVANWLQQSRQRHGDVVPGRYSIAILPRGIAPIETAKTRGVSFLVGILGGDFDGFEIRLNFLVDGPGGLDAVIRRDLSVLYRWAQGLDIGRTANPVDLVKQLGMFGEDREVVIDLGSRGARHGAIEFFCTSVAIGGRRG